MEIVVLGLGSNRIFNGLTPENLLTKACTDLKSVLSNIHYSSVYKTGAMYVTEQDDFYNMVLLGLYDGSPQELLNKIHLVENRYGRDRSMEFRNGPRPLDIDIELFGFRSIHTSDLVIPHERLTERAFVLIPLLEILHEFADDIIRNDALDGEMINFSHKMILQYEKFLLNVQDQRISRIRKWTEL